MTAGAEGRDGGQVEPIGAPTDLMRPTGRVDARRARMESRARAATASRRSHAAVAIGIVVAVLLAVVALVALAQAFD